MTCPPGVPDAAEVYAGLYVTGFEVEGLVPCGDEGGTVSGPGAVELRAFHRDNRVPAYHSIHATVCAVRVGPGEYGHMGASRFNFHIYEVFEARLMTADDCKCAPKIIGCP